MEHPPPSKPRGLELNLWYDVGPMRPDEYLEQRAMRWSQAVRDQLTHKAAIDSVEQEARGFSALATEPAGRVG